MRASIAVNMRAFLSEAEIKAAQETMGVDRSLIADRTYFVIETDVDGETVMVACGGWGKRRTLYGGDHLARAGMTACPIRRPMRPASAPCTRIRTGSVRASARCCWSWARARRGMQDSTTSSWGPPCPGRPLYEARGYEAFHTEHHTGANGERNTVIHMRKPL
jgi:hypothetical protein